MTGPRDIRGLTLEEITAWCKAGKLPLFRSVQIYDWLWKLKASAFDDMTNLPLEFRKKLEQQFAIRSLELKEKLVSMDGTVKCLFQLHDGHHIEGVLIPDEPRTTACISTQAGCPLACRFCATGLMGFKRDLSAGEIFDQFVQLEKISMEQFNHRINNIVYMGMGEPLLNFDQTMISVGHLTDPEHGLGISQQRITVSTAGIPDGIRKLGEQNAKIQLAVSLHTANQDKRKKLMPLANKYSVEELSNAIKYYHGRTKARTTIEYLLLLDINDGMNDAKELAAFCRNFPVKINIIEYNDSENRTYKKSTAERTRAFKKYLENHNMVVNIRKSKGQDIHAACGQLTSKRISQT